MKKNKALIECKENFFTKFRIKISLFFNKLKADTSEQINIVNQHEVEINTDKKSVTENIYCNEKIMNNATLNSDFNLLKNLVNKKISIDDIDLETEKRLIKLCTKKSKELDEKLNDLDNQIIKMNIDLNTIKKASM